MNNVLIVEGSTALIKSIEQAFKKETQLKLLFSENGEEAINTLEKMHISVLITDLYMPKVDGLELLTYMSQHHSDTPIIMTAVSSPEIMEILANLGIYRFLKKPFKAEYLAKIVTDAISHTSKGKQKSRLSTSGFLQLLQEEQRSCTLEITNQNGLKGSFYLIDGRLYDAEYGDLRGEDAAISILGWENVPLKLKDLPSTEIKAEIHLSLKGLISKAEILKEKHKKKQQKADSKPNLTDMLNQAIGNAESGNIKTAQQILSKILKVNSQNSSAWLWFARTADNFKAVRHSLKNASIISPDDSEIAGEIKKLKSAVNFGCGESSKLNHCPFCWSPITKEHETCHYCYAHLDIHEDFFQSVFFSSQKEPDLQIIEESLERYTKMVKSDYKNDRTHFLLSLTHINLNQWEEAFEELKVAKDIAQNDNFYQKRFDILSEFMNDLESFFTHDD